MTELENKLAEKILEKIDMDKLTDKIAEKAAELIIQREYPATPVITPKTPWYPSTQPEMPYPPITVMYGVAPVEYKQTSVDTEYIDSLMTTKENTEK